MVGSLVVTWSARRTLGSTQRGFEAGTWQGLNLWGEGQSSVQMPRAVGSSNKDVSSTTTERFRDTAVNKTEPLPPRRYCRGRDKSTGNYNTVC